MQGVKLKLSIQIYEKCTNGSYVTIFFTNAVVNKILHSSGSSLTKKNKTPVHQPEVSCIEN